MNLKAKHILLLGAFIVLTLLGYRFLPHDEIVIQTKEEENLQNDINDNLKEMKKKIIIQIY